MLPEGRKCESAKVGAGGFVQYLSTFALRTFALQFRASFPSAEQARLTNRPAPGSRSGALARAEWVSCFQPVAKLPAASSASAGGMTL